MTAGDLIRSHEDAQKNVKDVQKNQDVLVEAVRRISEPTILDGHFCLLRTDNTVTDVPSSTFVALAPVALALVSCDVSTIAFRLKLRDGRDYDPEHLQRFQDRERQHAEFVRQTLGCPLVYLTSEDTAKLRDAAQQALLTGE